MEAFNAVFYPTLGALGGIGVFLLSFLIAVRVFEAMTDWHDTLFRQYYAHVVTKERANGIRTVEFSVVPNPDMARMTIYYVGGATQTTFVVLPTGLRWTR